VKLRWSFNIGDSKLSPSSTAITAATVYASLVALLFILAGCTTPISADKSSVSHVYKELRRNALQGTEYSNPTRVVLRRYDLEKAFRNQPEATLQE